MLADQLAAADPSIAVARVDCGQAERFCDQVIGITRTPSFKVGCWGAAAAGAGDDGVAAQQL